MRTHREDSQCDRARGSARDDTSAWGRFRPGARRGLPSSQWAPCARGSARLQRRGPCTLSLSLPVAQAWSAVSVCISTGELMRVRLPWTLQKAHFTSHVPMSVSVDRSNFFITWMWNLFFPSLIHPGFIKHLPVPGILLDARDTKRNRIMPTIREFTS